MLRLNEVKLPLEHDEAALPAAILARLGIAAADLLGFTVFKRSYDARKRSAVVLIYSLHVEVRNEAAVLARLQHDVHLMPAPDTDYKFVAGGEQLAGHTNEPRPIVIGTGPCGLFVALILAQMGLRPLILERGKQVRERTVDTFGFWRKRELNPESNVQFGEGGAGTFSDGKLYSQIKDPKHYGRKVLTEFVKAGAPEEIMYVSKPHIGTFRLVKMVEEMRANIERLGGEYRFSSKVVDLDIVPGSDGGQVRGVVLDNGETIASNHVVLAIGHSARDTFEMLHRRGVYIEAKPFSIGFRVEHPQSLIDSCRFGPSAGHPILGAADYKLVHHASNGRSVYSFCMCPGGTVVAAASEPGRLVTNGMSQYSRNERNANSAIVVGITPADYPGDPLAGIALQRELEERAFALGGGNYDAPGQLVGDFVAGRASTEFGSVVPSYKPAVHLTDLAPSLPEYAITALREAFPAFNKQIKGYYKADAVLTGVETRTSSPIRIKRRDDDLQSLNTRGLFPAGEGAGYAGGILSAAVDGIKVAEAVALSMAARG
ncbi:NAD(P)/FAD-dependent oxidoreductase [Janthinobacterium lividum]|uniref:NAD(P)/FAD-dependent oxidoreductase n=1 Tax=Janthinobacterium lividum TaxID=29581 RepID=A0AAJ4T6G6_9BURK|nr:MULTISPECIES: NAD(P)/FAD-dependent oxidoreductase [Janthinobacterium]KAB0331390.1 NAD(P)/FAD-dependent oxidoreductase [Janthinobacterium lividum]MCC7698507.1 NAD(P)/FAD-dependent oxidoreductase [Janthinobacterium sp. EB271-G4-7A]MCC7714745.1 NAD(P)/FAD-dependent oxidoreductase [Janthinobacterium lividum]MDQ4628035.1 NAD(P)/FAD-dependent oxidoreductase [Janthinobacterium lividum]MDQ4676853.1 NAD(P)/FAD-dependent oxidoreductase [Janthinobacterium lividum]